MAAHIDTEPLAGSHEPEHGEHGDAAIGRGASVGRYVLLDRLGSGGMGVVYAAWDPELDRRVAIKLIADRKQSLHQQLRARLKREAQAMAKLDHPNVVKVFDVGEAGGSLFVAMEYVDGVSLRRWLADAKRTGPEILAAFRAAGQGLAAAHAQGVVHRDFKADNVLVASDGRVRVLDFGLASLAAASDAGEGQHTDGDAEPHDEVESGSSEAVGESNAWTLPGSPSSARDRGFESDAQALTVPGTVIGTPAYMAPEQQRGLATDARTDQYTFCAALWEALTGTLPFGRGSMAATRAEAGQFGAFERDDVHADVQQVLRRGLAWDRTERWPDMLALLDALEPPAPRRRWLAVAVGVVAVALGVIAVAKLASRDAPEIVVEQCDDGRDRIAELWTAGGAELRPRFVDRDDPTQQLAAERTWPSIAAELDRWTERWIEVDGELCRRYGASGISSFEPGLRHAQVACLDLQLVHFEQLTEILGTISDAEIPSTIDLLGTLPNPRDCREFTRVAPSSDAVAEADPAQIEAAERELARIKLEYHLSRLASVEPSIMAFFEATNVPGLERQHVHAARFRAQWLIDRAQHDEAIDAMLSGVAAAERHGGPELRMLALLEMANIHAGTSDGVGGRRWLKLAQALAPTLTLDRRTRATLAATEATVAIMDGRHEDALAAYDRALAATDPIAERFLYFGRLQNRAVALSGLDRVPEALEQLRRLDQLMSEAIDPSHQRVLQTRYEIALMEAKLGHDVEAMPAFLAVAEAMEASEGGPTMYSLGARSHAAALRDRLGDCAGAIADVEPVIAKAREVIPPHAGHFVNMLRRRVGMCEHGSALAVDYAREVLDLCRAIVGDEDTATAAAHADLALALLVAGELQLARPEIERALEIIASLDPGTLETPKNVRMVATAKAVAALVRHGLGQPGALDEVDSLLPTLPEDSTAAKRLRALR
ncbi:MAG TPA: serine/threonine-protein kinase [Enhygromyxa sp.]|nr:serine/threonine-protein kinase [Enhygromyxa sp.]